MLVDQLTLLIQDLLHYGSEFENMLEGFVDEVRIWKRALSGQEINASRGTGTHPLFRNFTRLVNFNYSYYTYSVDEGGGFTKSGTRFINVNVATSNDVHATNITQPLNNETNISFGGSVNNDFTIVCDLQNRNDTSSDVYLIVEENTTSATWTKIPTVDDATAFDFLTVPNSNPGAFLCGDVSADSTCSRTWTVSGLNVKDNVGLRCRSNSTTSGSDDSTSDRTPTVNVKGGSLEVAWISPLSQVTDILKGKTHKINATITCEDFFCGGVNWTARTNDSDQPPEYEINSTTHVRMYSGTNNFDCGILDTNSTCSNEITINMSVGSSIGKNRTIDINAVSNNTNVSFTNSSTRTFVGIQGYTFLYLTIIDGIYNRGDEAIISVLVKDKDGQPLSNATVNITVFYPNNSVFVDLQGEEYQTGRYNVTFSLAANQILGTYRISVNTTSGNLEAFGDSTFVVRTLLTDYQNTSIYNISSKVIHLNFTLLNDTNFGKYSLQNILDDIASTKELLETLLERQYDLSQEEIFLITDSIVTIDNIASMLQSGQITDEDAKTQIEAIRQSVSAITGKVPASTSPPLSLIVSVLSITGTALLILIKRGKLRFRRAEGKSDFTNKLKSTITSITFSVSKASKRQKELKRQLQENYLTFQKGLMPVDEYMHARETILNQLKGEKNDDAQSRCNNGN